MDASIAMNLLQKIVSRDQDFCPKSSNLMSLYEVQLYPKYTEIIFVISPSGQSLRVETDIEVVYKHEADGITVIRTCQLGTTRMFEDNHRNKRVEVTTVDIERYRIRCPLLDRLLLSFYLSESSTGLSRSLQTERPKKSQAPCSHT